MNIKARLEKLEQSVKPKEEPLSIWQQVYLRQLNCDHSPSAFHFYREYPPKGYRNHELITKGHCDGCGFEDYMWSVYHLTDEQEDRRQDLMYGSDSRKARAYDLELIDAGLLDYVAFPPPVEEQLRYSARTPVRPGQGSQILEAA